MTNLSLLFERPSTDPAPWRLRMPLLVLALALGGCAPIKTGQQTAGTPLVAYTTVGSGQPSRAQPFSAQAESSQPRSRNLSPIRGRARYEDDAATGNSAAQPAAGERTTLNFNDAELHGVLRALAQFTGRNFVVRSEEHTSELQSLMRISYAVFCLKKKQQEK